MKPSYKQDKALLKKLQEKDLSINRNPRLEGHPPVIIHIYLNNTIMKKGSRYGRIPTVPQ